MKRFPFCGFAFALAASVSASEATVEFRACPKCECRFRLDVAANKAYVNTSRVAEKDRERVAARAARYLGRPGAPKDYDEKLGPLMGWSSWNSFGVGISEEIIVSVAQAMATNGLAKAGYRYVNIDDGFFGGRGPDGRLKFHPKRFPNGLKPTVDAIHALGLKAGIYSDAGSDTCGSMWGDGSGGKDELGRGSGLYRHDADDCRLHFRDIGFDFIKVDFCGGLALKLDERRRYSEIAEAIRATGRRDVRLNVCRWAYPGTWISDVAGSWRATGDIRASWRSIRGIVAECLYLSAYASPGHFNDMDMLEVGQVKGAVKSTFGADDTGLTDEEEIAHFGMWCMMSSPLLIGCDVRTMRQASLRLVTNPYLVMMSQNRGLGLQGRVVSRQGEAYVLAKDADELYGKSRYVALYNANDREHEFRVESAALELAGEVEAFDLVDSSDIGAFEDHVYVKVPAHAARFFRFDAEERLERKVYEAEDAFLTGYQELRDAKKSGSAYPAQVGRASNGVAVKGLGGRETNDLVWRDVRIVRGGLRRFELYCESEKDADFVLCVDEAQCRRLSMKRTHGSFVPVSLELELEPGVYQLRLSNAGGPMPDVDVMILK